MVERLEHRLIQLYFEIHFCLSHYKCNFLGNHLISIKKRLTLREADHLSVCQMIDAQDDFQMSFEIAETSSIDRIN